ncbi:hypothetical protein BDV93DRAFT_563055 [Ceratobasidium sp. AG-I]|nr:hypothetical protein BDV93DRAFT_563055 [Ceratobasidium sp. AG-I]
MSDTGPPPSRIHALIIGINVYEHKGHKELKGCVPDAMAFMDYLTQDLGVPQDQIMCLLDKQATRKSILDAFQSHLINNVNIKHSDPIVVYFAGHGTRVAAPPEWHSNRGMCEMILPYDASWSNMREDIEKGIPPTERESFVHGIPDRTLGSLINKLHNLRGDNITVILDSCFSASGTRTTDTIRHSEVEVTPPNELDNKMHEPSSADTSTKSPPLEGRERRGPFAPDKGTHVLLAACLSDKTAREISVTDPTTGKNTTRGLFTFRLLEVLRACDLSIMSYCGLIYRVAEAMAAYAAQHPRMILQTPQCEGSNQDRLLFQTKFALSKRMFQVFPTDTRGEYLVKGGNATGIVAGTEFAVYPANMALGSDPVAQLVAIKVGPTKAILSTKEPEQFIEIPSEAYAQVARFRDNFIGVRILVVDRPQFNAAWEKVFSNLISLPIFVIWTQSKETSDIVLEPTQKGALLQSQAIAPLTQATARLLETEEGVETLTEILSGVVHFHYHLRRKNAEHPFQEKIGMQLLELEESSSIEVFKFPIYAPKENAADLFREYLATGGTVEITEDPQKQYGLMLTNDSGVDLFPYVLYYDPQDYSIACLYNPPEPEPFSPSIMGARVLPGIGALPIGYGSNGQPMRMKVPKNYTHDLGFFVMLVSTHWVDIKHIIQDSPFEDARETQDEVLDVDFGAWDTVTVGLLLSKPGCKVEAVK